MAAITSAIIAVAATAYAVQQSQEAKRAARQESRKQEDAMVAVQNEQIATDKSHKENQGALAAAARQRAIAATSKRGSAFASNNTGSIGQGSSTGKTLTGE